MIKIGDKIKIIKMKDEVGYDGKEGYVENIDDMGQLHGSWGGLAVIPNVDEIEVFHICPICGKEFKDYGNNADPINCDDVCDDCNIDVVIPLRIYFSGYCDGKLLLINTNNEVEIIKIDTNNTLKQLQTLLGGLVEVVPKEDDKYLYLVDEEGLFKSKELNWIGENLFDITVVGDIVVIPKEYFK